MYKKVYCIKESSDEFLDALVSVIGEGYSNSNFIGFKLVLRKKSPTSFVLKKVPLYGGFWVVGKMEKNEYGTVITIKMRPPLWFPFIVFNPWLCYMIFMGILSGFSPTIFVLFLLMGNIFIVAGIHRDASYFFSITDKAFSMMTPYARKDDSNP